MTIDPLYFANYILASLYEEFSQALARFNHGLIATSVLSDQLQVHKHFSGDRFIFGKKITI